MVYVETVLMIEPTAVEAINRLGQLLHVCPSFYRMVLVVYY